jgi:hypothetical protein
VERRHRDRRGGAAMNAETLRGRQRKEERDHTAGQRCSDRALPHELLHPSHMALREDPMAWAGGIYPVPLPPPSYSEARSVLAQYERSSSWLLATTRAVLSLVAAATPAGVLALSVFVVRGDLASYALGLVSLSTAWLPVWVWKQRLWERYVRQRLAWRSAFDPQVATVSVRLSDRDSASVVAAIRRAGLTYQHSRISAPDGYAVTIAVAQWAFGARRDDATFREQVCDVVRAAGIAANVGGVEV